MISNDNNEFAQGTRRLLILQIAIGGFVALGCFAKFGELGAQSSVYGSAISVVLSLLLIWGVRRASATAAANKKKSAALLYVGAAQRFLLALVLFALGLAKLGLNPLALVLGFGFSQAAYLVFMRHQRSTNTASDH